MFPVTLIAPDALTDLVLGKETVSDVAIMTRAMIVGKELTGIKIGTIIEGIGAATHPTETVTGIGTGMGIVSGSGTVTGLGTEIGTTGTGETEGDREKTTWKTILTGTEQSGGETRMMAHEVIDLPTVAEPPEEIVAAS